MPYLSQTHFNRLVISCHLWNENIPTADSFLYIYSDPFLGSGGPDSF